MRYIITSSHGDYLSDLIKELNGQSGIRLLTNQQLKAEKITIQKNDQFYIPSDTVYSTIREHFDPHWQKIIENCRNKYQFRQTLKPLYPNFIYDQIALDDLDHYSFDFKKNKKYVIKPTVGFMAGGARIISKNDHLSKLKEEITTELREFATLYPNIFSSKILIEEYIGDGDEYAVDMYYTKTGKPCIINIYSHPPSKRPEYLQLLYYCSKQLFDHCYAPLYTFFENFNADNSITSFPIHAEFKRDKQGNFIPIEFNACRFGGMGVADLTYYTARQHPVLSYFQNQSIDWRSIWNKNDQTLFSWLLAYNAADKAISSHQPNHKQFKKMLPSDATMIDYIPLDYQHMPAFAITYLKINQFHLDKILSLEFNDCFEPK